MNRRSPLPTPSAAELRGAADVSWRARSAIALAAVIAVCAAALLLPVLGRGQETAASVSPSPAYPVTGLPAESVEPIGASPASNPGEVWGIGTANRLATPDGDAGSPNGRVLLRQVGDGGWQYVSRIQGADGKPLTGFSTPRAGPSYGRVTARGGVVVAGRLAGKGTLLARAPGAPLRPLPAPEQGDVAAGAIYGADQELVGQGRVTLAAVDENDSIGVFVAPIGGTENAVAHFDGTAWSRERIELPTGATGFTAAAIVATGPDRAWLLGSDGRSGLQLYERDVADPGVPKWTRVSLGSAPTFATTTARALAYPAEGLTAVGDGLWLDGGYETGGKERTFTLFFDLASRTVIRSWCNTDDCDDPLEFEFSIADSPDATTGDISGDALQQGYRSFAWEGDGVGTRIITNPRAGADGDGADPSSYVLFGGQSFSRVRAFGPRVTTSGSVRAFAAFTDARTGWLAQSPTVLTRVSPTPPAPRLQAYPLPVRAPLLAVVPEPGRSPADPSAAGLAVGYNGQVLRYGAATGWLPEPLPSGSGRATPRLTAVAWPEARRAHVVGADGAMWIRREEAGQWERDEGAPLDADAELFTGVAFQPGNPDRGYATTQSGRIYRYDKSWVGETVPAGKPGDELFGVAFAGPQALVAGRSKLLVNDGSGWRVDEQVAALLKANSDPELFAAAGLPDGGAVAAGSNIVLIRDSATAPWRVSDHPVNGTVSAVSAVRDGAAVRAVAILARPADALSAPDLPIDQPGQPPSLLAPRAAIPFGSVVRETAAGWLDDERSSYPVEAFSDCPLVPDPALALALDERGQGWVVGGDTGRRSPARCATLRVDESQPATRAQTAVVWRYGDNPTAPGQIERSDAGFAPGPARLLFGGHAACAAACADLSGLGISPDRNLASAVDAAVTLRAAPNGPRALVYTGGRVAPEVDAGSHAAEQARYAQLMTAAAGRLPLYVTPSQTDAGVDATGFNSLFASLPAPQGNGPAPSSVRTDGVPGGEQIPGARTHYAFDTTGPEGTLRVAVIDNSKGSLSASDATQFPLEGQLAWLGGVLDDARRRAIPAIVVGSRPLTNVGSEKGNATATDGAELARLLVDRGASAYVFDSPEKNVAERIPSGASTTIPSFGTGSLGYESVLGAAADLTANGLLLLEADMTRRDAGTNRVPVTVTVQPVLEDLAIDARDGTVLRRSTPSLFTGLGRRPRGGDRRNEDGSIADPYVSLPNAECAAGCGANIAATFRFTSSNPEIGDFVKVDPAQAATNPRAVFLDSASKPVSDGASGLFCAFNPGTTEISVTAGGLTYSTTVRVLAGSARQPCGTRATAAVATPAPAAPPAPSATPAGPPVAVEATVGVAPPPPPPLQPLITPTPVATPTPTPAPAPVAAVAPLPVIPPLPLLPPVPGGGGSPLIVTPPPPVGGVGRPSPPGGATVRVYEEKREEEEAFEQSSASVRYEPNARHGIPHPALTVGLIIVAAAAGSSMTRRRRDPRGRRMAYARTRGGR